jgi:hypothetical protein
MDPRGPWFTRRDIEVGVGVVVVLAVVGVLIGLLWWGISPGRPLGVTIGKGQVVADETESFISTDGRFLILTAVVGLIAGFLLWTRRAWRGPVAIAALAVGGFAGALLTDLIGRSLGGGQATGPLNQAITLPLSVHARSLWLAEPFLAVLVYGLFALFAAGDDLGRAEEIAPSAPTPVGALPPV